MPSALLDMLPLGVFVLNHRAKVVYSNSFAARLLHSTGELQLVSGTLRARSLPHNRALNDALRLLYTNPAAAPLAFSIARPDQPPISVAITTLPRPPLHPHAPRPPRIAVLVSDPGLPDDSDSTLLRSLFDFTPAESHIAALMLHALDTASIARTLGIARNTLRDHLKAMFHKTNTRNQGELLHLLLRSPAALLLPRADLL